MTNSTIDYDQLELALQNLQADINASEIHGTLCALLVANNANTGAEWFQSLVPEVEDPDENYNDAAQPLVALCEETRRELNDPACDFQLILPEDDNDIATRTTALSDWCQGFIMGLMMCGIKDFQKLPENSAEVLQDMTEISRVSSQYELEDTEEDAAALEELIEFVRVGVMLINEELNPDRKPARTSVDYDKLH